MVDAARAGRPLTYHAVHRMFERAASRAGSVVTLHALRHTAAYRMAEDPALPLTDVQLVLGHARLSTTQVYLTPRKEDVIRRVLAHHAGQARAAAGRQAPPRAWLPARDAGRAVREEPAVIVLAPGRPALAGRASPRPVMQCRTRGRRAGGGWPGSPPGPSRRTGRPPGKAATR